MKKKTKKTVKPRNWLAVHAHSRTSAGPMKGKSGNRKAEESRNKCRKKIQVG